MPTLADVAHSRRDVDQVIRVLSASGSERSVSLVEGVWAEIALLDLRDLFAEQRMARSQKSRPFSSTTPRTGPSSSGR